MTAPHGDGADVAAVIDERIVQSAKAGARIERGVLDAQRPQHVDHQVRAVFGRPSARVQVGARGLGDNHAATGILRSSGSTLSAYRSRKRRWSGPGAWNTRWLKPRSV